MSLFNADTKAIIDIIGFETIFEHGAVLEDAWYHYQQDGAAAMIERDGKALLEFARAVGLDKLALCIPHLVNLLKAA